jgi:4-alpha-glucanotransferase
LVSPVVLLDQGLLDSADLEDRPEFPENCVDYGPVIQWKLTLLERAYIHFKSSTDKHLKNQYRQFQQDHKNWLPDFALFIAIKESHGGVSWDHWSKALRLRSPRALSEFRRNHLAEIDQITFRQFLFYQQWNALHAYANSKDVKIVGDIPIFVAYDSADAWGHPDLFLFDKKGNPTVVAGVPPDYFSPTGQLWGNPIYNWEKHAETGYAWWIERFKAILGLVDIVRLDHFRGFAGYWEVPAGMPTAEIGRWVPGPSAGFLDAIKTALSDLPIIAEDLGEITPDVVELRDQFNLPGMKILQFAFSTDATDPFLPHNYPENCVVYTGTHDNDTSWGWYHSAPEAERDFVRRYLARSGEDISWDLLRAAWSSVALMSLAPMQDLLSLGTESRMNFPGKASGNWGWRMPADALNEGLIARFTEQNELYGRKPGFNYSRVKGHK